MCLYLTKREGTYYFRRVIPVELRPQFDGASEFMFSLRTKIRVLAKQRRSEQALLTDNLLTKARRLLRPDASDQEDGMAGEERFSSPDIRSRMIESKDAIEDSPERKQPRGPLLHTIVLDQWAAEREPRPKTIDTFRRAAVSFHKIVRKPLSKVEKSDVVAFKKALLDRGTSTANARCLLSRVRTLFQYANDNDIIKMNPAAGVTIPTTNKEKRSKRLPFSLEGLRVIFSTSVFTSNERPTGSKGEAAAWMPLLALFTGARLEELAQLRIQDVNAEEYWNPDGQRLSAPCLHIREDMTDRLELKTEASERLVPIHRTLKKLGFLDYVQSLRDRKAYWLFPEMTPGAYDRRGVKWGEWFGRFLRKDCGIKDKRLVFHSFRHLFKDLLRAAGIEEGIQRQLMGHRGRDAADGYGKGYSFDQLVKAMDRVRIPGLQIRGIDC